MLAVDRQHRRAAAGRGVGHQFAGGDQRFLVGQRDGLARLDRGHDRAEPGAADDRGDDQSASPAAASTSASSPAAARHRCRRGARASRGKPASSAMTASSAPVRRAMAASAVDVGRGGHRDDLEPSGERSTRSSVDVPTEPVAPRIAILRRHVSPDSCASAVSDSHRHQPVEPVEHAAVARKPGSAILDPGPPLHPAFEQVAALRRDARRAAPGRTAPAEARANAQAPPSSGRRRDPADKAPTVLFGLIDGASLGRRSVRPTK